MFNGNDDEQSLYWRLSVRFYPFFGGSAENPHTCSCSICQKHTGAYSVSWVEFDAQDVTWTGQGDKPAVWRSSNISSRAFCSHCGSSVGAIDDAPTVALLTGVFDEPQDEDLHAH